MHALSDLDANVSGRFSRILVITEFNVEGTQCIDRVSVYSIRCEQYEKKYFPNTICKSKITTNEALLG